MIGCRYRATAYSTHILLRVIERSFAFCQEPGNGPLTNTCVNIPVNTKSRASVLLSWITIFILLSVSVNLICAGPHVGQTHPSPFFSAALGSVCVYIGVRISILFTPNIVLKILLFELTLPIFYGSQFLFKCLPCVSCKGLCSSTVTMMHQICRNDPVMGRKHTWNKTARRARGLIRHRFLAFVCETPYFCNAVCHSPFLSCTGNLSIVSLVFLRHSWNDRFGFFPPTRLRWLSVKAERSNDVITWRCPPSGPGPHSNLGPTLEPGALPTSRPWVPPRHGQWQRQRHT